MADTQTAAPDSDRSRLIAIVVWGLYLAAVINGITALAGVVLAYVSRGEARGTVYESHFSHAIETFWISLLGLVILIVIAIVVFASGFSNLHDISTSSHVDFNASHLLLLPVLGLGGLALFVWYLYRSVTGLVRAIDAKPY